MDEKTARRILGDRIQPNNNLYDGVYYVAWNPSHTKVTLDDEFSADELEAIVWWMRNKYVPSEPSTAPAPVQAK